jgi:cytochrome c peroxidase
MVASTTDVWAGVPLPVGFPKPTLPADNQLSAERIALGRKLFYEPALSRDSSLSCGSCHQPALAFSDGKSMTYTLLTSAVFLNKKLIELNFRFLECRFR